MYPKIASSSLDILAGLERVCIDDELKEHRDITRLKTRVPKRRGVSVRLLEKSLVEVSEISMDRFVTLVIVLHMETRLTFPVVLGKSRKGSTIRLKT